MLTDKQEDQDQVQKQQHDGNALVVEGGGSGAGQGETAGGDDGSAAAAGPGEAKRAKKTQTAAAKANDEGDEDDDRVQSILQEYNQKIAVAGGQHVHRGMFTTMRSLATASPEFVKAADRSMTLLAEDALAHFPQTRRLGETPSGGQFRGYVSVINDNNKSSSTTTTTTGPNSSSSSSSSSSFLTAVSIVRSGDALLEVVRRLDPTIKVGKILIQRDETSEQKHAVLKYHKLPHDVHRGYVLLCDPMLATGGSAIKALEVLTEQYNVCPTRIIFANMISCPQGLRAVLSKFPALLKIVTVAIDPSLNSDKYIVPGLGDYGDRYYDT
mmetsp:Transcript_13685/g.33068  ORF Transcript_13685/g.33068 Transcript_13685/m.33068 type:complete len:326 (-) Transcript_13685:459-1436(-)